MNWSLTLSGLALAVSVIGMSATALWTIFRQRDTDLESVNKRIEKLAARVAANESDIASINAKLNNGIKEEIGKLREARHMQSNVIQKLIADVEHLKGE